MLVLYHFYFKIQRRMLLGLFQSSISLVQYLVSDSSQNHVSRERGSMCDASAYTKGERWGFFPKLFNLNVMSPHTFWVISVLGEHSDVAVQGGRLHGAWYMGAQLQPVWLKLERSHWVCVIHADFLTWLCSVL